MSIKQFVRVWVPVIAWMILIFAGSSDVLSAEHTSRFLIPFLHWLDPQISFQAIAAFHLALRKVGHVTEYAILAALLLRALWPAANKAAARCVLLSLAIAAGYAALDEFHQSFVASRTALDDATGAVASTALLLASTATGCAPSFLTSATRKMLL